MGYSSATPGITSGRIGQRWLLDLIQGGESFNYCLLTREGAVKFGVTVNLMNRKSRIDFGGVKHFLAFRPGTYGDEQALHRTLSEWRIYGTREYYWPYPELLPTIDAMREWMNLPPLHRKALPRLASCTFVRRVQEREARDRAQRCA